VGVAIIGLRIFQIIRLHLFCPFILIHTHTSWLNRFFRN